MNYQQLIDVGFSEDMISFECCFVVMVDVLGFFIILGVLMCGLLYDVDVQIILLGNMLVEFLEVVKDFGEVWCDFVMVWLMMQLVFVVYDQQIYVIVGVGEVWEVQVFYGYKMGIVVKLYLLGNKYFLLGVDCDEVLLDFGVQLM